MKTKSILIIIGVAILVVGGYIYAKNKSFLGLTPNDNETK